MADTFNVDSGGAHGLAVGPTSTTWSTVRDGTTASGVQTTDTADNIRANLSGADYLINRYFMSFDTSALDDSAVISAAVLHLTADAGVDNANSTTLVVVQSSQDSPPTALQTEDYNDLTFTSGGSINIASISANTDFDINFNATGLGFINKTGHTKIALIIGRDLDNSAPTGANRVDIRTVNYATEADRPTLEVTYTVPTTTSTSTSTTSTSTSTTTTSSSTSSTSTSTSTSTSSSTTSTSTSTSSSSSTNTSTSSSTTTGPLERIPLMRGSIYKDILKGDRYNKS